jgi:hypothetical protein
MNKPETRCPRCKEDSWGYEMCHYCYYHGGKGE